MTLFGGAQNVGKGQGQRHPVFAEQTPAQSQVSSGSCACRGSDHPPAQGRIAAQQQYRLSVGRIGAVWLGCFGAQAGTQDYQRERQWGTASTRVPSVGARSSGYCPASRGDPVDESRTGEPGKARFRGGREPTPPSVHSIQTDLNVDEYSPPSRERGNRLLLIRTY